MKKGDLFQRENILANKNVMVEATGEFRPPKKGECFISGAIPEGYLANNDLSTAYYIGRLVEVETQEVTRVKFYL